MTAANPRSCCGACEIDWDSCRDQFCPCHDGIASMDADPIHENDLA